MSTRYLDPHVRAWGRIHPQPTAAGCWEWLAARSFGGYGQMRVNGRQVGVHRWLYEETHGPIPVGMDLDHLCRNRACVNPAHLEPVTRRENLLRGNTVNAANARKTHCRQGHELSSGNVYMSRGERRCATCARRSERERYQRRTAQ